MFNISRLKLILWDFKYLHNKTQLPNRWDAVLLKRMSYLISRPRIHNHMQVKSSIPHTRAHHTSCGQHYKRNRLCMLELPAHLWILYLYIRWKQNPGTFQWKRTGLHHWQWHILIPMADEVSVVCLYQGNMFMENVCLLYVYFNLEHNLHSL
jgi:hypothetical protein